MNAFCNTDDISWGTKNLDTKKSDHDAIKMHNKALAYKGEHRPAVGALTRAASSPLQQPPLLGP